jgi:hypothetical protein
MGNLALVLNSLGNLNEAEEMQRRAVGGLVHRVLLRKNHDNILTGMANLACIHLKKGMKKKAGDLV